jgi:small-conductance mechanosensitive channel
MNQMDWNLVGSLLKTWTASIAVFSVLCLSLSILKRAVLQRLSLSPIAHRTRLEKLFLNLVRNTKFFFIFAWSLFAGLTFHDIPASLDQIANRLVFLASVIQLGIWSNALIAYWVDHYLTSKLAENAAAATTLGLMGVLIKIGLYGLLILATLQHFGVDITALVAGLGVGGIAVALAVQNILGDLFASLTIVLDKPFIVGDSILTGDLMGTVERIGLKTTRIRSVTGEQLVLPNGDLLKSRIRNFKRMEERRVTFLLHVTYSTSPEKLQKIPETIQKIIEKQDLTRFDRSNLKSFGSYGIEFETVFWVKDQELSTAMKIQNWIHLEIFRKFKVDGIQFAYLQNVPSPKPELHIVAAGISPSTAVIPS